MNHDLAEASAGLANILDQENIALAALDLACATALLARKNHSVAVFAAAHRQAAGEPGALDRPTVERLRHLAAENKRLLERAITVQGQVVGLIAGAVPRSLGSPRYTAAGGLAAGRMPALALSARA